MTYTEAIGTADLFKPNSYSEEDKRQWLLRLEKRIKAEIIETHGDKPEEPEEELFAPAPFDEMYLFWLEAQMDYHNGEIEKYNNSITAFNNAYSAFERHYNRTHLPKGTKMRYF